MKKKIIIFGAGDGGKRVFEGNKDALQVVAFCDNDPIKLGTSLDGIPIVGPNCLPGIDHDFTIIGSIYHAAIKSQLIAANYPKQKIKVASFLTSKPKNNAVQPEHSLRKISETCKCRASLSVYCIGDGIDIGYGGDPIVPNAICMDLPKRYAHYESAPQHLHGSADNLYWFKDEVLDWAYSSHVFEDFEDTRHVLEEALRVIKPGGYLILYLPDEQSYRSYCQSQGKPPNAHHIHDNFSLDFVKESLAHRKDLKIIHEVFPSNIYSFELVLQKLPEPK